MTTVTIEQLISELETTQGQISALLQTMADNQDWQPDPDHWSFRYIAAHLATSENECLQERIRQIASGGNPHFERYLNTGRDFSPLDLRNSLHDWAETRHKIIDFLRALPEEKWSLSATHDIRGTVTILDHLRIWVDHDKEHLEDLEQMLVELTKRLQRI